MKVSILIPKFRGMPNWEFLLNRCLESAKIQTFKDYEIVMPETGLNWPANHNVGIRMCRGQLIKILQQDDYFTNENSLQQIVDNFKGGWLITGCDNNSHPYWTDDIYLGNNKLGGPSCLTIKNDNPLFFDESLEWLTDCEYYQRLYNRYGKPTILEGANVNIGIHKGQATNLISNERKQEEFNLVKAKYENFIIRG